jgi:hypothetical protein
VLWNGVVDLLHGIVRELELFAIQQDVLLLLLTHVRGFRRRRHISGGVVEMKLYDGDDREQRSKSCVDCTVEREAERQISYLRTQDTTSFTAWQAISHARRSNPFSSLQVRTPSFFPSTIQGPRLNFRVTDGQDRARRSLEPRTPLHTVQ